MLFANCFNPRTYIRYDASERLTFASVSRFNPRTYIRYDINVAKIINRYTSFNPRTYIRYDDLLDIVKKTDGVFQSTYLYKVRQVLVWILPFSQSFNPRTYIRYDTSGI